MAIDKVIDSTILDKALEKTASAIEGKMNVPHSLNWQTNTGFEEELCYIESEENDNVFYYDYDGTILGSIKKYEYSFTDIPAPTHEGLTYQGLSWVGGQSGGDYYFLDYNDDRINRLNIGYSYITNDGTTRIYIHLEKGRTSPSLSVCPNGTVDVDWGDGTAHDTLTGSSITTLQTASHNYATPGDYVIRLAVDGTMGFKGTTSLSSLFQSSIYLRAIEKIELGSGISSIANYSFNACYNLKTITIPRGVTTIGTYAFQKCYNLKSLTLPHGLTSIGTYAFSFCCNLQSLILPTTLSSLGTYACNNCYNLKNISIPSKLLQIPNYAFNNCFSLKQVSMFNLYSATIGQYAFAYCYNLKKIYFSTYVIDIGSYAFLECSSLTKISATCANLGNNCFSSCCSLEELDLTSSPMISLPSQFLLSTTALKNFTIPSRVTTLSSQALYGATSLVNLTIPSSVTSIAASALYSLNSLGELHFKGTTPPTVSNSNAFSYLPADCKIYVPTGYLSAYTSASNYPSSATYTYIEE